MSDDRFDRKNADGTLVTVRGVPMDKWQKQLTEKLLAKFPRLIITQGPWSDAEASANTHNGSGVVDLYLNGENWRDVMRYAFDIGWFGWHRPAVKDLWKEHLHLGIRGHKYMAPGLKQQQVSWTNLRNGLKGNGPDSFTYRPKNFRSPAPYVPAAKPTTLRIASYNFPAPGTGSTPITTPMPSRIDAAMGLLKSQSLHMIGWQELGPVKREGVASATASLVDAALGKNWGLVKPTRGYNENYLSYRSDVLEVVHQYEDSILESARGGRHITRVVLRYRKTGFVFAVGVAHLVNGTTDADERARRKQAMDAWSSMEPVSAKHGDCPVVICYDANTSATLPGGKSARQYADDTTTRNDSTFTPYSKASPTPDGHSIIDQIYVWRFYVVAYKVLRNISKGKYVWPRASDHDPVVTEIRSI